VKAAPFDYLRARSLDETCAGLRRAGGDAKLIAGGQSLVPMMAMRLTRPALLIDINDIAALQFVVVESSRVRMGACMRQCVIERDDALAARVPLLRQALAHVGHIQTRNRGTLGGSLAHADPAAELPLAARVLDATLVLRSAAGEREVAARAFFLGPLMTDARADECLTEVRWPLWDDRKDARIGSAFVEVSRRHGDFALVSAAAQLAFDAGGRCTRAAFGIGGGASTPCAFPDIAARLTGARLSDDVIDAAAHDAARAAEFAGDLHAGADYRRHLARVLAGRALREARTNATTAAAGKS
jgi:CO/xanthine dehydrogenase FAD-binding subunit